MDESVDLSQLVITGKCGLLVALKHPQFETLWNQRNINLIAFIIEYYDGIITFGFRIKKVEPIIQQRCEMIICPNDYNVKKILLKDTKLSKFVLKFAFHISEYSSETIETYFRLLPNIIFNAYDAFTPIFSSHSYFEKIIQNIDRECVFEFVKDFIVREDESVVHFLDRFDIFKLITAECYPNSEKSYKYRKLYAMVLTTKVDTSRALDQLLETSYYTPIIQNEIATSDDGSWEMLFRLSALTNLVPAAQEITEAIIREKDTISKIAFSKSPVAPYALGIVIQISCANKELNDQSKKALNIILSNFFSGNPTPKFYSVTKVSIQSLRNAGLLSEEILQKTKLCNRVIKASHLKNKQSFEYWSSLSDVSGELQMVSRDIVAEETWDEVLHNIQDHMSRGVNVNSSFSRWWIYLLIILVGLIIIGLMIYFGIYYDRDDYFFTDSDFDAASDL
ncbi:hypothetical protein TVAG_424500 [Trichomonas vaginalis G3]|uniref:Uncharacterized protein n=1 Tax=Trichomonas vaginalis (strain ATCC PRA-98 / G3) TaxID=412133 RepID=A2E1T9_TRIV3|nr:hypothetical protein TVAGG3_0304970 [Trichomonas vaginalis G3]EAY13418.1 hypothetical protein TVAG_424500 [Trichomonas vaginalis G3]KAI5528193.1 hypothetical protein TVAGG3_0304970 [Trichomonas vaginalis G3]|eukprot:XP_001325641.1 hypothetical protein [Trichomonas vaginalis G3]